MHPVRRTLKRIFGVVFINDRKDVRLMFNCFLAALVFWCINALQKDYTAYFFMPVRFSYDETRYLPEEKLPEKLEIELKANGWNLIQKSFGFGLDTVYVSPQLPQKQFITVEDLSKWSEGGMNGASFEKIKGDSLRFNFITLRK